MTSASADDRTRRARVLPVLSAVLPLAGAAGAVVAVALVVRAQAWTELAPVLLPVPWLVAAALAARARPDHPGAVLFLGLGAGHLVAFGLSEPVSLDRSLDGWPAWSLDELATQTYLLGFVAVGAFLATYPSGLTSTAPERWFVRGAPVLAVVAAVLGPLTASPVPLVAGGGREAIAPPPGLPLPLGALPFEVVGPLAVVVGAVLLVVRSRRASGEERRQLSWGVGAAGLLALLLLATPALVWLAPTVQEASFLAGASVVPFVLLAGLVRFRLMDVDLYVARTFGRGAVVVLVLSAYAAAGGLAGNVAVPVGAALTAVAALSGMPLARRLERRVDRWLSSGRLRGQQLLRRLSDQLDAPSPEERARLAAGTVRAGLEVSWVRLVVGRAEVLAGQPRADARPETTVALVAGDVEIGRLECGPRHGGWSAAATGELQVLARHIALALHAADLSSRLARQVAELTASRRRIVRAELGVRKQLERDLHDGVQQQVVAVIAALGALPLLLGEEAPAVEAAQVALAAAQAALSELRQVVDGVQPPVLRDHGLVAAVESRAALLPVPVRVRQEGPPRRWPADVESAAYYVVSEALTNVVKHSTADAADVLIAAVPGGLRVSVHDDGVGLPPELGGSGLAGLRDRVEALGGRFDVTAAHPGTAAPGAVVTAELPAGRSDDG